jgi:hypothetical protein
MSWLDLIMAAHKECDEARTPGDFADAEREFSSLLTAYAQTHDALVAALRKARGVCAGVS